MERRTFIKAGLGLGGVAAVGAAIDMTGIGAPDNPYLMGNYAPVLDEITETSIQVTGSIPTDLNGLFLRNGPNPVDWVNPKKHHWFLGDGMLHGVRLDNGNALWYKNRRVLGNDSTANTSVISHAGHTYAIVEAGGYPVEIDGELNSLDTKPFFGDRTEGFTAHPKYDADTGELHAICYDYGSDPNNVRYVVIDDAGRHKETRTISLPSRSMVHECAITQQYVLLLDLPITLDFYKIGRGYLPFSWNDAHQARIGLISRADASADIQWFDVDPTYIFHTFNAHEDNAGRVVFEAAAYGKIFDHDWLGPFNEAPPLLKRYTLDIQSGKATIEQLDDRPIEFPRIHPALYGKSYRYGYALGFSSALRPDFQEIKKYDFEQDTSQTLVFGNGKMAAEPVFVPRAGATNEDDGYLLTLVFDPASNKSDLVIVPAEDLSAGAIATIHLPRRVPFGFHGDWITA